MLTLLLYVVLAIVVVVVLFVLASNFLPAGEQIAPALREEPIWSLPDGSPVRGDDVDAVKLPVAIRGYRFAETDALLDLLAEQLRERDREIARLKGGGDYPTAHLSDSSVWARPSAVEEPDGSDEDPLYDQADDAVSDEALADPREPEASAAGLSSETTTVADVVGPDQVTADGAGEASDGAGDAGLSSETTTGDSAAGDGEVSSDTTTVADVVGPDQVSGEGRDEAASGGLSYEDPYEADDAPTPPAKFPLRRRRDRSRRRRRP